MTRHPTTVTWKLPPEDRARLLPPARRVNLRALEARPERFEHHLMIIGTIGDAQIEIATASEPLYFAHRNISDEYALPLLTGDPMLDAFPFRTFFSDVDTGEDVGRVKHKAGQLILHPHGLLHWPGRLRAPHQPFEFAPGMRRTGLTMVYCGNRPVEPNDRPLFVSRGHKSATKAYTDREVPFMLADLGVEEPRVLAVVGNTHMELLVEPSRLAPPNGGFVLVLDAADESDWFATDFIYLPAGASIDASGIHRAVVIRSDEVEPERPPDSWDRAPAPPFPVFEEGSPGSLPVEIHDMVVDEADEGSVELRFAGGGTGQIPRYWLARFLFRTALHDFRLGYLETYGGFYYDDAGDAIRLGRRDGGEVRIPRDRALEVIERFYRAVAPPGYVERVD